MTNHKPNVATNAHRPVTPVVVAASIVMGLAGGGLVLVNPALARLPDSRPLASSLVTSDRQVQRTVSTVPSRLGKVKSKTGCPEPVQMSGNQWSTGAQQVGGQPSWWGWWVRLFNPYIF
jgi:hypothetical protein